MYNFFFRYSLLRQIKFRQILLDLFFFRYLKCRGFGSISNPDHFSSFSNLSETDSDIPLYAPTSK